MAEKKINDTTRAIADKKEVLASATATLEGREIDLENKKKELVGKGITLILKNKEKYLHSIALFEKK